MSKEIDQCHGRPDGTARRNFNTNKVYFVEGVDYFKAPYDEVIERTPSVRSIFDIANESESVRGRDYSGFIYIVQDISSGYWKIGRTSNKKRVEKRLNLSRSDNLKDYQYFECVDTLKADKMIQDELKKYNVKNSWYDCDVNLIIKNINNIISKVSTTYEPRKKCKGGFHGDITLITESGYLMLVKSLKFNINVNFLLFLSIFSYNSYLKKQIYIVYDFFVREKSNSLSRGSLAIRSITPIPQKGMVLLDDFEQHRFSVNRAILHILLWLLCS